MEGYFWRLTHVPSGAVIIVLVRASTATAKAGPGARSASPATPAASRARSPSGGRRPIAAASASSPATAGSRGCAPTSTHCQSTSAPTRGWTCASPTRCSGRALRSAASGRRRRSRGLSQYVSGRARLGERALALDGAVVYAEQNRGRDGFPPSWWWGQAHGFARDDVCVAFAAAAPASGGCRRSRRRSSRRVGDQVVRAVRSLQPMRVEVGPRVRRLRARTARTRSSSRAARTVGAGRRLSARPGRCRAGWRPRPRPSRAPAARRR